MLRMDPDWWSSRVAVADSGCWLWQKFLSRGYGHIWMNGRNHGAHRVAWASRNGPVPDGMFVCHSCDVRSCVNPEHLFIGTQQDNIQDARSKGRLATGLKHGRHTHPETNPRGSRHGRTTKPERTARGVRHARAVLNDDKVRMIRRLSMQGLKDKEIADIIGQAASTVFLVRTGRNWSHVLDLEPV